MLTLHSQNIRYFQYTLKILRNYTTFKILTACTKLSKY